MFLREATDILCNGVMSETMLLTKIRNLIFRYCEVMGDGRRDYQNRETGAVVILLGSAGNME